MSIQGVIPDGRIPRAPRYSAPAPPVKSEDEEAKLKHEVAELSKQRPGRFWEADPEFKNFRSHSGGVNANTPLNTIQISGSSQPTPSALAYLADQRAVGIVVDLREEPHGYINNPHPGDDAPEHHFLALSYTNHGNWPNPGINTAVLLEKEKNLLHAAKRAGDMKLVYESISKQGVPTFRQINRAPVTTTETVPVTEVGTEKSAVAALNRERASKGLKPVEYYRIPVTDELPPTPEAVDKLVLIYRHALATGKNIHFHCEAGRGRTTTAMTYTGVMDGKSVEDAVVAETNLNPELDGRGKDIREIKTDELIEPVLVKATALRLGMLYRFHDYWNSPSRSAMDFSDYMKQHPMDHDYLVKMTGLLHVVPTKPPKN